jgi:DNA-binding CsgD family transcriptional regulator
VPEFKPDELGPHHNQEAAAALIDKLSPGQLEVLRLVDQHLSSKEIAARLGISPHTVDQRIRNAIRILGVARRQDAARLVAQAEPYQRLIHQAPHLDPEPIRHEQDGAISYQIRHADRAEGIGSGGELDTEQRALPPRSPLVLPWSTRSSPRNEMSIGQRLLWIVGIAIGASFSAGMYLAGLESLARMAGH